MKLILIVLLVALCALFGVGLSAYYRRRRKFYDDLYRFNLDFLTCLQFSAEPLETFLETARAGKSADFGKVLDKFSACLREGEWDKLRLDGLPLSAEERARLQRYFTELGGCDVHTEREKCGAYREQFCKDLEGAKAEEQKNSALSVKLGIYFGLLAVILII